MLENWLADSKARHDLRRLAAAEGRARRIPLSASLRFIDRSSNQLARETGNNGSKSSPIACVALFPAKPHLPLLSPDCLMDSQSHGAIGKSVARVLRNSTAGVPKDRFHCCRDFA